MCQSLQLNIFYLQDISILIPDFYELLDLEDDDIPLPPLGDDDVTTNGIFIIGRLYFISDIPSTSLRFKNPLST